MYPITGWEDIGALATAAAAIIATVAIGLAWAATVIAKRSTDIDRRGYVDALFDQLISEKRRFEAAELPYWQEKPDAGRIRKGEYGSALSSVEYDRYHQALLGISDAVVRLQYSGLAASETTLKIEKDVPFVDMLLMLNGSCWASYHTFIRGSKAASERWLRHSVPGTDSALVLPRDRAWKELEARLVEQSGFDAQSTMIAEAREIALDEYKRDDLVTLRQLNHRVSNHYFHQAWSRYVLIADQVAPWHKKPRERRAFSKLRGLAGDLRNTVGHRLVLLRKKLRR